MDEITNIRNLALLTKDCVEEALWPTRCAVCDRPGSVLCSSCRHDLPYLDTWRACPVCGAAFGRLQCTECNPVMLKAGGYGALPFEGCTSALMFNARSSRIPRAFKDHGARDLGPVMARLMFDSLTPEWVGRCQAVTFIPATRAAVKRRGFDHGQELAEHLGKLCNLPARGLLPRPYSTDQRKLSRTQRFSNMRQVFQNSRSEEARCGPGRRSPPAPSPPKRVLLADDVMTTGSTLFSAATALKDLGVEQVWCVTFLRV